MKRKIVGKFCVWTKVKRLVTLPFIGEHWDIYWNASCGISSYPDPDEVCCNCKRKVKKK